MWTQLHVSLGATCGSTGIVLGCKICTREYIEAQEKPNVTGVIHVYHVKLALTSATDAQGEL